MYVMGCTHREDSPDPPMYVMGCTHREDSLDPPMYVMVVHIE